ncbi:hypothetical protein AN958_11586 [Leucoagaricus sp. SymC.cos]|nr:hypothetical protein AN958_11586 [Leucoagaricus sp. SymC.cos]
MLFPFLLRFLVASSLILQVLGQNSILTFNWKFRTDFVSTSLPRCFNFDIVVFPNPANATAGNYSGTPPYYMLAFPEGGQPITSPIGNDNNTLSWTPEHPIGTQLILTVMDSLGNTGGTGGAVYQVVENPDNSNCSPPPATQGFKISSNITQDGKATLETCQPWRLNIDGGIPPYTVVLDAKNAPVITNVTIPPSDNALVFIDRADPGTVLFAGVVDSLGRWANGTQFVSTTGSTNITCPGAITKSGTQADFNQQEARQNAARNSAKRRTSIIVGVVVSLVLFFLIVGGVGTWLYMRRKKAQESDTEDNQDVFPRQFVEAGSSGRVLSINNFMSSSTTASPSPSKAGFSPDPYRLPYVIEPYTESLSAGSNGTGTGSAQSPDASSNLRSRPSFANFPASSVRRSKGQEAAQDALSESNPTTVTRSSGPSGSTWPVRSGSLQANGVTGDQDEVIIQHTDGGQVPVVRELPPPYIAPPDRITSTDEPDRRT